MGKLLVTGATGNLGRLTLEILLERLPAEQLAGLSRTPERQRTWPSEEWTSARATTSITFLS